MYICNMTKPVRQMRGRLYGISSNAGYRECDVRDICPPWFAKLFLQLLVLCSVRELAWYIRKKSLHGTNQLSEIAQQPLIYALILSFFKK